MDLVLGLSNGSLQQPTLELLRKFGMEIKLQGRNGKASLEGMALFKGVVLMRPQDIPVALIQKKIDCGICGLDWVVEQELDNPEEGTPIIRVKELNYSKVTRQPARIILFGRQNSPPIGQNGTPVRINAEYPNITRNRYPNEQIVFSHGSTEVKVAMDLFDYGVCLTETGSSIRDNGLEIIQDLLVSPTVLIAREHLPEIDFFGELLEGALKAEQHQVIKMNVDRSIKTTVLNTLPALRSPTVNPLADRSFAIETIVKKSQTADLLVHLQTIGATGILVQDINVILP